MVHNAAMPSTQSRAGAAVRRCYCTPFPLPSRFQFFGILSGLVTLAALSAFFPFKPLVGNKSWSCGLGKSPDQDKGS